VRVVPGETRGLPAVSVSSPGWRAAHPPAGSAGPDAGPSPLPGLTSSPVAPSPPQTWPPVADSINFIRRLAKTYFKLSLKRRLEMCPKAKDKP